MKRLLFFAAVLLAMTVARAASPSFGDFTSTQFRTNGNKLSVKDGAIVTNLNDTGTFRADSVVATNNFKLVSGAGANKIMTSDGSGNAAWATLTGVITNSMGTVNTLAKFTATNAVGDSIVSDRTNHIRVAGGVVVTNNTDSGVTIATNGIAGGTFVLATNSYAAATQGGFAMGKFDNSTDATASAFTGGFSGGNFDSANGSYSQASEGSFAGGNFSTSTNSSASAAQGGLAGGMLAGSSDIEVSANTGLAYVKAQNATSGQVIANNGSLAAVEMSGSDSVQVDVENGSAGFAYLSGSTNTVFEAVYGSLAFGSAVGTTDARIAAAHGSFAGGMVGDNESISAENSGSFAFGQDVTSGADYAWTFGKHFTNNVPNSFAVGFAGTTNFMVRSNGPAAFSGAVTLSGNTNQYTDNGTALLRNGVAVGGGSSVSVNATNVSPANLQDTSDIVYSIATSTNIQPKLKAQAFNQVTFSSSTNLNTIDCSLGSTAEVHFYTTLTNNAYAGLFSNIPTTAKIIYWHLKQDGTGNRLLMITNGVAAWPEGVPFVLTTNANAVDILMGMTDPFTNNLISWVGTGNFKR